ncbi:MAG: dihydroneopterin triphosphate diphosphatase [Gammaproteobacteria bacterium]|nr:dihydroneopterin triphosphate diphosphatase [Gammaproteobacteria bacterium]
MAEKLYKRPESVLVVVYARTGKVLLLKRADGPDYWQSVTGSMHWGDEQPLATAVRELREETGITVSPQALRDWRTSNRYVIFPEWRHKYAPGTCENTEHVFSLELPEEVAVTLTPAEHTDYAWVPLAAAATRVFSWTNRQAIEALAGRAPRAVSSA